MGTSACCGNEPSADEHGVHKVEFLKVLETCPFDKLADKHSEYVYDKCGRNLMEMW